VAKEVKKANEAEKAKRERDDRGTRMAAYMSLALVAERLLPNGTASIIDLAESSGLGRTALTYHLQKLLPKLHGFAVIEQIGPNKLDPWRLTPSGRELAYRTRILLTTTEAVSNFKAHVGGVLRVGGFNAGFRSIIADRVKSIGNKVNIELIELHPKNQITNQILAGAVDVCIDWIGEDEVHPAESEEYLEVRRNPKLVELVAIASGDLAGDFSTKNLPTSLNNLAAYNKPLVMVRSDVDEFRKSGQLTSAVRYISCHTIGSAVALVEREVGIGVVWEIGDLLDRSTFSILRFKKPIRRRIQYVTIFRKDTLELRKKTPDDPLVKFLDAQ